MALGTFLEEKGLITATNNKEMIKKGTERCLEAIERTDAISVPICESLYHDYNTISQKT